jgi:capsular polysaccharide transport system ATP-binding protein
MDRARLLMISHSAATLRQFCDAGLLIEAGRLTFFESLDDAIAAHEANLTPTA